MSTVLNGALRLFVSSHHLALQPILRPSSLLKEFPLIAYPTITKSVTPETLQLNPSISTKFKEKFPKNFNIFHSFFHLNLKCLLLKLSHSSSKRVVQGYFRDA